jgi:hypothetical protein
MALYFTSSLTISLNYLVHIYGAVEYIVAFPIQILTDFNNEALQVSNVLLKTI